jgi:regulator of replication initiation timing
VLTGEIDVEGYIRELEITFGKLTGENEALRNENESLKKKLPLYENPHTPIRAYDQTKDHRSAPSEIA